MIFLINFVVISLAASVCVLAERETELINVPPYSMSLEDTVVATVVLKYDLKPTKPESAEFLKVYLAVIDLADQVNKTGENAYSKFYSKTTKNSIKQVIDNATKANDKFWDEVNNTNKKLVKILSFVLYKQLTECANLTTNFCDAAIQRALDKDRAMQIQAPLLIASGKQGKLFLDISNRIRQVEHFDAEVFLNNGSDVMKPLVLAAYETQKIINLLRL